MKLNVGIIFVYEGQNFPGLNGDPILDPQNAPRSRTEMKRP